MSSLQQQRHPPTRRGRLLRIVVGLLMASTAVHAEDFEGLLAPLHDLAGSDTDGSLPASLEPAALTIRARLEADLGTVLPSCPAVDPHLGAIVHLDRSTADVNTPAHPLLQALGDLLDDPDQAVRDATAFVLGELGPIADALVEPRVGGPGDRSAWLTHAAGRSGCEPWSLGDALDWVPASLRDRARQQAQHPQWPMLLASWMLRDPERIWPDGLVAALHNDEIVAWGSTAAPLPELTEPMITAVRELEDIAADPARELRVRLEVLSLFARARSLGPAADGLRVLLDHPNDRLSAAAAEALIESRNAYMAQAMVVLLDRHGAELGWINGSAKTEFCAEGIRDPALLQSLSGRIEGRNWGEAKAAVAWMGCARSESPPATLLAALSHPSWEVVQAAMQALAPWLERDPDVRARLSTIAAEHWSGLLRGQARTLLHGPEGPPEPEPPESDEVLLSIHIGGSCFHRCLTDHLNAACGVDGEVADGIYQSQRLGRFAVTWQHARRHPPPTGFPLALEEDENRPEYGTNSFLAVDDGWLVGVDLWHYDGWIQHVSHDGSRKQIGELGEKAVAILDTPQLGRIVLGGALFGLGHGGLLASVERGPQGWSLNNLGNLPSPPWAWAFAPDGTLLVADPHNAVAVHADLSLEALSCPSVTPDPMPARVLDVVAQVAGSPLPRRREKAILDEAVLAPLVERKRQHWQAVQLDPQQLESWQSIEEVEHGYRTVLKARVSALQFMGQATTALDLLSDPILSEGARSVGQRANLLAAADRQAEALAYLRSQQAVEQYEAQFMLTALALATGEDAAAQAHLAQTRSSLLLQAERERFQPDQRYIDILGLIAKRESAAAAADSAGAIESWPDPLLHYLRGQISEPQLVPSLYRRDGRVDRERLCEALVYLGIGEATAGRRVLARRYFEAAVGLSIHDFIEHTIALMWLSAN